LGVIKDKYLLIKLTPLLYMGSGFVFSEEASEYEAFFGISQNNSLNTASLFDGKISL